MAVLILENGEKVMVTMANDDGTKTLSNCVIKSLLDCGFFEAISLPQSTMLVDEMAKIKGRPVNESATRICHNTNSIYNGDFIAGPVLICEGGEL